VTIDVFGGVSQELGYSRELMSIELVQQRCDVFPQRTDYVINMRPLQGHMKNLLTPVILVRLTAQVSRALKPRNHTGDRTTCESSNRTKIATGHGPAVAQQVEALVIRWAEFQALRDRVVKQDDRSAMPTR
jgi:hypothetical protein